MDNSRCGVSPSLDEFLSVILDDYSPVGTTAFVAAILGEQNYNPDEPRDERGRWTTGGSQGQKSGTGQPLPGGLPRGFVRDPVTGQPVPKSRWQASPQSPPKPLPPTSAPYASTIDPFSPDFDPNTWAMNHNWDLLQDFLKGTGPSNRFYGPDTIQTFQVRQSPGAAKLRDAFYASGCKGVKDFEYKTGDAARDTVFTPNADPPNTATQVGGFADASAVNNGNGTVTFTIPNDASRESFLYHGFHVFPVTNPATGPMRTIHQTFQWTERIDKSRSGEGK